MSIQSISSFIKSFGTGKNNVPWKNNRTMAAFQGSEG